MGKAENLINVILFYTVQQQYNRKYKALYNNFLCKIERA